MLNRVDVYYNGWGEHWLWGTLVSTTNITGRPLIAFEYSHEAKNKGLELSSLLLPLQETQLRTNFPSHQLGLPGPVYDALPDGWGMLLMDRLFKRRGLNAARIGALERLAYIGDNAIGAMSFEPISSELENGEIDISLEQLAAEVQDVLNGEGEQFLQQLLQIGGSPQGARPKALIYRDLKSNLFTTVSSPNLEAWLVKFPANHEHPEVCAIEMVYAECLRMCGIQTPDTLLFTLKNGLTAFASKRFDRENNLRVPMQSLASYTGADYTIPGSIDYLTFLRATHKCTNDVREKKLAFERAVFNVIFNNRDDHPKNFAYVMSSSGEWKLAPAYDVTFCEGPGGYHQMDIMGQALEIDRGSLLGLARDADISEVNANEIISKICQVAQQFTRIVKDRYENKITQQTLKHIQQRINENMRVLD
ncbi:MULTISPECIES: type II toxin-antitoxin system HipA family toxin [Providencia]|nr:MULTISPECIES: type II toxin-antitoxin system HipA family toxin [Providencia]MTC56434.1 type II toxin-antitoxin system HipA family toxin [Providencia rustigianii]SPY76132.1 Serine/threonine-protein kinase HipA [Providencia rustigianii]SUC25293.1 Serine/threonine-protein kinase HipA [Providencia rustigianii]SUC34100.1 Serine/threonine-protein kinase HipA [Providencia rustigianii]